MKAKFSRGRSFSSGEFHPALRPLKLCRGVHPSVEQLCQDGSSFGSVTGRNLLQSCISGDPQIPARRGTNLRPLSSSSIEQVKQLWGEGSAAIKGEQMDMDILEFGQCQLHGGADMFRLKPQLEPLMMQTFGSVVESMNTYGYKTRLSRFDLFHGHLFRTTVSSRYALIGMLFHCAEYPAMIHTAQSTTCSATPILKEINLGFCQQYSTCQPSLDEWRYRNVVWSTWWDISASDIPALSKSSSSSSSKQVSQNQAIWLLDGASPEIHMLRVDGSDFGPDCPNSVYEGFLGETLGDVICIEDQLYFTV